MKIRCKNCYRVLDPQEKYCKNCGTYSEEIARAMETGNYDGGVVQQCKLGFVLYGILAFAGTGVFMTILAMMSGDTTRQLYLKSNAVFITSILATLVIYIVCRKSLKDYFWNGNKKQFFGALLIGVLGIATLAILSKISSVTRVLPSYLTDYLAGGDAKWFSGRYTNIFSLVVSHVLIVFTEELVFRRILVDTLDDQTMLGELSTVLIVSIIGTLCDFAWVMSTETLICSFFLNLIMTGIYMNTNRSLGLNIVLRLILLFVEFVLFLA